MLIVIVASQQTNRTNMSDDSIIISRRGKKRRRVHNEGDVSINIGGQNRLFHDLRRYFDSKFSEVRKENER